MGGLIGLGGAEFRLPVILGAFGVSPLPAVVINLTVSFVTVVSSIVFRAVAIPFDRLAEQTPTILNLLIGTIAGSFFGVSLAARIKESTLVRMMALLLVLIGLTLLSHDLLFNNAGKVIADPVLRFVLGALLGIAIGVFSSLLGIAGGELIIPTLILIFSLDAKLAGSVSLVISVPTILVGLARYHRKGATTAVRTHLVTIMLLAIGSILGTLVGSQLLYLVSDQILRIILALILFYSAGKMLLDHRASYSSS